MPLFSGPFPRHPESLRGHFTRGLTSSRETYFPSFLRPRRPFFRVVHPPCAIIAVVEVSSLRVSEGCFVALLGDPHNLPRGWRWKWRGVRPTVASFLDHRTFHVRSPFSRFARVTMLCATRATRFTCLRVSRVFLGAQDGRVPPVKSRSSWCT